MALDKTPRRFKLVVTEVEIFLNVKEGHDKIVIEFPGTLTPSTKKRLQKALSAGLVELGPKVIA